MRHSKDKKFPKRGGKPHGDKRSGDQRAGDKRPGDRRQDDRRSGGKPQGRKSEGGKPKFDKPRDKPSFEKRTFEKPSAEKPVFEKRREPSQRLQGPLLWGFHAVRSAWKNPNRRVTRLLITEVALDSFKDTIADTSIKRPAPEILDKGVFDHMMPPGAVHQGIAALVENLPGRDAHDLIAGLKPGEKAMLLILDQVTDPHNVGAILRSAAAFGAKGIIMQDRHAPELGGVLAKTASGAADVIPVAVETNLSRAIELLQENDFFVLGLDEGGTDIGALPKYDRIALVLGAEGSGLRQNVANHCDGIASLPTEGEIRSLNVSNAAAVALYALKI